MSKIINKNETKEKKKKKKHRHKHTERTPGIYVLWPLAYIHGWQQRESYANKFEEYKDGAKALSKNPILKYIQITLSQKYQKKKKKKGCN